jgi:hypothetical protein
LHSLPLARNSQWTLLHWGGFPRRIFWPLPCFLFRLGGSLISMGEKKSLRAEYLHLLRHKGACEISDAFGTW